MVIPSVLSVCGKSGELRRGKEVHGRVMRYLLFSYDVVINNSLIEMYAKCGCLDDSYKVFLLMGARQQNLITWSTLISCFGVHGKVKEALTFYNEMLAQGFWPNPITFISILSSCSHSGLVDEGRALFDSMTRDYGIEPSVEHYACMVDLLGRAGQIREALRLIEDMPMEPAASVWGALLSACAMHRSIEVAEVAAHKLFELEPRNSSNYIALCGIYEMVGMWENAAMMRAGMRELGMMKTPGCSWIDVRGRMCAFFQGDVCLPSSGKVCEVLDGLCRILAMETSCDIDHEVDALEGP
nr:pentatricopeptide repeat protein AaPPR1130 [Agave angustifolia]